MSCKVVIPNYVAEYIEKSQSRTVSNSLYLSIVQANLGDLNIIYWLHESDENMLKYCNAWRYGYEIDEKVYTTAFTAENMGVYLYKDYNNELCYGDNMKLFRRNSKTDWKYRLTEQEIKKFDIRFWETAKKL